MTFNSALTGRKGEDIAATFLTNQGYTIVARNFRTRFGEVDIIAQKSSIYYFTEVKARIGIAKGKPYEAVTKTKINHLKRASELYVLKNKIKNYKLSLMVISIIFLMDLSVDSIQKFIIDE